MEVVDEEDYEVEWVSEMDEAEQADMEHTDAADCDEDDLIEEEYLVGEEIIPSSEINTIPNSLDQIAAENLIYMAHDGNVAIMGDLIEEQVEQADNADYNEQQYFECQVQEEVITDDWVQQQGEDHVEVVVDQLGRATQVEDEIEVPLPTDQDEYTASRPYPCDFCSRRFRKKANLMNHMVAHKNDRPHICNLCGARYIRRVDLLHHLKVHAQVPEQEEEDVKPAVPIQTVKLRKPVKTPRQPKSAQKPKLTKRPAPRVEPKREYTEQDDLRVLIDAAQQHAQYAAEPEIERYPVIDPARPFVCQKCGVSFAREKALLSHSRMHAGDSSYECDNCSEIFWDAAMLREHQRIHHAGQSSNSEYEPDKDGEKDSDSEEADSKFGVFYCTTCGMSFHRTELLFRHQKTHVKYDQDIGTPHCCNVCGESFVDALDLLAHAEIHTRCQPYKCMLCGETFVEEYTVKKHLINLHAHEMSENSCRLCGKLCRDARSLIKHSWEHSSERNHSCSKCGKTFHNKARLKRHMQSHRNKSVRCDNCGDEFPDGRTLMNHRHSHTNVSGRQFPCKECGKTFGSRSSQQIHMRIHTGERPYGCRFCWKAFADGGTLRKHERIHTGEKPYACPVCPRAFNQRVVLREHIRSHHSGPDNKHGNANNPYYCAVCGNLFISSALVIQHLIEHSDMNTAMKRQPPTGPRKYKRRRKLKPHELEQRARNEKKGTGGSGGGGLGSDYTDDERGGGDGNGDGLDDDDEIGQRNHDMEEDVLNDYNHYGDIKPVMDKRRSYNNRQQSTTGSNDWRSGRDKKQTYSNSMVTTIDDGGYTVYHHSNEETPIHTIETMLVPSISGGTTSKASAKNAAAKKRIKLEQQSAQRPKMIHTQKMRVPVEDGKRKTRTLITRTAPAKETPKQSQYKSQRTRRSAAATAATEEIFADMPQPMIIKQEDVQRNLTDAEILLELSRKNLKYSPDVVNDLEEILRSPVKARDISDDKEVPDEYITSDPLTPNEIMASQRPQRTSARRLALQRASEMRMKSAVSKLSHQPVEKRTKSTLPKLTESPRRGGAMVACDAAAVGILDDTITHIKMEREEEISSDDVFTCEMCSRVFHDRAQLLLHVPVHI